MNTAPQRLRIKESGWKNYTGHFGGVEFKNSISVHPVDPITAARLGSIISITLADTDEHAGGAAEMQRAAHLEAAVVAPLKEASQSPQEPEVETTVAPTYTRESLEAIADAKGIAGLRDIAEPMGIKGRGIAELIEEIMKKQGA